MSSWGSPVLSKRLSPRPKTSLTSRNKTNPRTPEGPQGPQNVDILRMSPLLHICTPSGSWIDTKSMKSRSDTTDDRIATENVYLESTSYILGNFLDSRFILDKRHTSEGRQ
jgi:hypothetical protein